ncbi:glycoside hydrolase family 3 protein [Coniophora puteana RWD-64-598 SS2]|uniref:beta-glucosidase n=1 Tax=Coniophora puteana (strain RWD-64-598) TaxID=741705 RepID=A0A5M3M7L2_CONPW|nr:glycoside hydrolase family 3 protein [Coniophora puteana RWD-64-598 SS2]EIW74805.1 glycoside hydrolase family 3 protein [Coniophora puteana RWD-64-598 SS2]
MKYAKLLSLLSLLPVISAASSSSASSAASSASSSASGSSSTSAASSTSSSSATSSSPTSSASASSGSTSSSASGSAWVSDSVTFTTISGTPVTTVSLVPTETGAISVPFSKYPFTPFPTPTLAPNLLGYPSVDPLEPPPVRSDGPQDIPDFAPAWAAAYEKAKSMISDFSVEEKVNITTGVGWAKGLCVGNTPPVRDFPGFCLEDSPLSVRFADFVTAFPAGITVASTWNRELMRQRGAALGKEHKGKGVNVALGPMMNMGRIAAGGRNWEGFGADPYLTGESAYETILGMQSSGVQACAKHFIDNEQEHFRTQVSSNVDDRTQHELYAHPFLRSVMAGVASVMCSYNLVNDSYACNNDKMMNDVLKREYGFQGYVMSDWQATESTLSAVAGLDMTMPGDVTFDSGDSYFGGNLTTFVHNGTIASARLDDMATRIVAAWYYVHQDDEGYPAVNFNAFNNYDEATNGHVNVQEDHYKIVREIGAAGAVLLKNERGALPLNKPKRIVIVGEDAAPGLYGPNEFADQGGDDGVLAMGWGSGTGNFPYLITPLEGIQERARKDGTGVFWNFDNWGITPEPGTNPNNASQLALVQDAALVFINADSGEQYINVDSNEGDRQNLTAWNNGDNVVLNTAALNNNTIVVVHSVGPLIVEPWIDHPNVTAVVWANIAGQEVGNSIADVLYGEYNPSGKLVYTIAKRPEDYPAQLNDGGVGQEIIDVDYTEGLFIDYRHFDAKNIEPRFEFGFGLSYTSFKYTNLKARKVGSTDDAENALIANWEDGKATPIAEGSSAALWLHEPYIKVTFDIQNTGDLAGTEIPQLYLHYPASAAEPPSVLRGFANVKLVPNQLKKVELTLSRYDLSVWDVVDQGWRKAEGVYTFSVGQSSRKFLLKGTLPL